MVKQNKVRSNTNRVTSNLDIQSHENLSILKSGMDEKNFSAFMESFGNEIEQNKTTISKYLSKNHKTIRELGNMKINIDNIINFNYKVFGNRLIDKDTEQIISRLYVQELYKNGSNDENFLQIFDSTFGDIKNINDKLLDFKTLNVYIKFFDNFRNILEKTNVSNSQIFDEMQKSGKDIANFSDFDGQSPSAKNTILNLLNWEVCDLLNRVKYSEHEVENTMKNIIVPSNTIMTIDFKSDDLLYSLNSLYNLLQDIDSKKEIQEVLENMKSNNPSQVIDDVLKYLDTIPDDGNLSKEDKKELISKIQKKFRKRFINFSEKSGKMDKNISNIFDSLVDNSFDFSKLNKDEKTQISKWLVVDNIKNYENKLPENFGFDKKGFFNFMEDLYDFQKNEIDFNIGNEVVKLKIDKNFEKGTHKNFYNIEDFKENVALPFDFTVNIDENNQNVIDFLEGDGNNPLREDGIMETHMTKNGPLNIGNGYELNICGKAISKDQLDELLDCDYDDERLNIKLKEFGLYGELKDLVIQTKEKLYTSQGIKGGKGNNFGYGSDGYGIFSEILKELDINIIKRNLIFQGKDVDKLSQIYLLNSVSQEGNLDNLKSKQDKTVENKIGNFCREGDENIENKGSEYAQRVVDYISDNFDYEDNDDFDDDDIYDIKNFAQYLYDDLDHVGKNTFKSELHKLGDEYYDNIIDDIISDLHDNDKKVEGNDEPEFKFPKELENIQPEEKEETENEKIDRLWDSFPGDKDCKLEKGNRLFLNIGGSKLPPHDGPDHDNSFYSFEIIDVSDTHFVIQALGGDLPSSLSGQTFSLPKTSKQLERMKDTGGLYKVSKREDNGWGTSIKLVKKAGLVKKFTAFGEMEGQVQLKGNKFVNEKGEEIKYFDRVEGAFDNSKKEVKDRGQGEKLYKYEIKGINTQKGTVKIASTFDDFNENCEQVKYQYENELPFEHFILLIEGKRLKGYTKSEQEQMETKYKINDPKRLPTKGRLKRFSIKNFIDVFKGAGKAISDKIKKNSEEQKEDLENFLFSEEGANLYGKLGGLFSLGGMLGSVEDAFKKSQYEFYTNRENRTWKKIEEWYKIFESDPNYSEFFNEHLQHILAQKGYMGDSRDRYKFAAAFLIMVKKEGPYPRAFSNQKDRGKWVENLLGPEHKVRFLNFYEKKKNELEQEKDLGHQSGARLALQEELNKMEIQYIISTIDGRAPYGPNSNEFMLKSLWSLKFMSQLEENLKGYYNKHEEEKGSLETFYAAEESYLRNIGSGKFQKALPALERMCEVCKTPGEAFRVKGYLLGAMLMGIIKSNSSAKTIKSFWGTCRAMGFTPGYWMRDPDHPNKVQILLDGITNNSFSKDLKFNPEEFIPGNIKDGKYSFAKKFQGYRNSHGKMILDKLENPPYKENENDKSIMDLAKLGDHNSYIFEDIIKNSTTNDIDAMGKVSSVFAQESPLSATSNMMNEYIPQKGKYHLKTPEDLGTAQDFWKKVKDSIPNGKADKPKTDFIFKKFFNWFDNAMSDNEEKIIIRSLPLIKETFEKGGVNQAKFLLWYMIKGTIHKRTNGSFPDEVEAVMNKFVNFFFENINNIDKSTIINTFKSDKSELVGCYDKPYKMLNWEQFNQYHMNEIKSSKGGDRSKYDRLVSIRLRNNDLTNNDIINYAIEDMWKSIKGYCDPIKYESDNVLSDLPRFPVNVDTKDISKWESEANKRAYGDSGSSFYF